MTLDDTLFTLARNNMIHRNPDTQKYEIVLRTTEPEEARKGPVAKMELLTWVSFATDTVENGDSMSSSSFESTKRNARRKRKRKSSLEGVNRKKKERSASS